MSDLQNPAPAVPMIDAEELASRYTVEQLARSAESYFSRVSDLDYHLSKPFGSVFEAPTLLSHFGAMLAVLKLTSGMSVLDFGAGTCWTSRFMSQLGCSVTACDISSSALAIGAELYKRQPLVGARPTPTFSCFDGHRLPMSAESFDRITVMDAFHHVPNWNEVLKEFFRVLKPGGLVVMSEGGPEHSRQPQSQVEMRNFSVVERDVVVESLSEQAQSVGFEEARVGLYSGIPAMVSASEFTDALEAGQVAAQAAVTFLHNHRLISLRKPGNAQVDSRDASALRAEIQLLKGDKGLTLVIHNTGSARWLGLAHPLGAVQAGAHLYAADGALVDFDYFRHPLKQDPQQSVYPGEVVTISFPWPNPSHSAWTLQFGLVSEGIAWFESIGGPVIYLHSSDLNEIRAAPGGGTEAFP
jgi:2-polyprenyl-3-methyl-5-hydroxy-6-metoxy-1,4-benzoquinol methylase